MRVLAAALALGGEMRAGAETWEEMRKFVFEKAEMGLPFRVSVYAADEAAAQAGAAAAFARIAELNAVMSDYDSDSELSRLARTTGRAVPVSPALWTVLTHAHLFAERSDGAFDITVGPLVSLWRRARRKQELPDAALLAEMRGRVGFKKLRLDAEHRTAELLAPDMRLDLGAIAKGFACDEALAVLKKRGLPRALVGGGGDMAVGDAPPDQPGWRIEVAPLDVPDAPPPQTVLLKNCGLATSGDIFQRVEISGQRYSHIVDPRTGIGLTDHSLVTIIAPDGMTADALSTTVSVLGPERGLKLIEETPGTAAHLVRQPGAKLEFRESARWRDVPKVGAAP
ncbi:MAG: FAD:protein FMN transferase [Chthoniobacter sp.]|nr:FAD:protein FMN transferase [Chthoniobacter sp.]